jgi:hypothetical protein
VKDFVINRDSWHYALNKRAFNDDGWSEYYMRDGWERTHNNFCAYWRATVARMIAVALIAIIAIAAIAACSYAVYLHPLATAKIVASAIAVIITIASIVIVLDQLHAAQHAAQRSLAAQRYRVYKSRICPNIEYK